MNNLHEISNEIRMIDEGELITAEDALRLFSLSEEEFQKAVSNKDIDVALEKYQNKYYSRRQVELYLECTND